LPRIIASEVGKVIKLLISKLVYREVELTYLRYKQIFWGLLNLVSVPVNSLLSKGVGRVSKYRAL
jgi:hypothetical protein